MFNEQLPSREKSTAAHLARMIALFGPPPIRLLQRGFRTGEFFDKDGMYSTDDFASTEAVSSPSDMASTDPFQRKIYTRSHYTNHFSRI